MLLPAITSKWPSLRGARIKPPVDCQRTVRQREPIPVALTAFDKTALFLTQFPLQALRDIGDVLAW
jgi:hypothetical protein